MRELLARQVRNAARAGGGERQALLLGRGAFQIVQRAPGAGGRQQQVDRHVGGPDHRGQVALYVIGQLGVQHAVGRQVGGAHQQGIAVGSGGRDIGGADLRGAAGLVLHHHGLAEQRS
ncbi:hypothetical protein D9M68_814310 [compost metagenome]